MLTHVIAKRVGPRVTAQCGKSGRVNAKLGGRIMARASATVAGFACVTGAAFANEPDKCPRCAAEWGGGL